MSSTGVPDPDFYFQVALDVVKAFGKNTTSAIAKAKREPDAPESVANKQNKYLARLLKLTNQVREEYRKQPIVSAHQQAVRVAWIVKFTELRALWSFATECGEVLDIAAIEQQSEDVQKALAALRTLATEYVRLKRFCETASATENDYDRIIQGREQITSLAREVLKIIKNTKVTGDIFGEDSYLKTILNRARDVSAECLDPKFLPVAVRESIEERQRHEEGTVSSRWVYFSPSSLSKDVVRPSLAAFFQLFNPSKLEVLEEILEAYADSFPELFDALEDKYCPKTTPKAGGPTAFPGVKQQASIATDAGNSTSNSKAAVVEPQQALAPPKRRCSIM